MQTREHKLFLRRCGCVVTSSCVVFDVCVNSFEDFFFSDFLTKLVWLGSSVWPSCSMLIDLLLHLFINLNSFEPPKFLPEWCYFLRLNCEICRRCVSFLPLYSALSCMTLTLLHKFCPHAHQHLCTLTLLQHSRQCILIIRCSLRERSRPIRCNCRYTVRRPVTLRAHSPRPVQQVVEAFHWVKVCLKWHMH